eukprot:SAG11_NODE_804_length_7096_cov_14.131056_7_plen_95_part_00
MSDEIKERRKKSYKMIVNSQPSTLMNVMIESVNNHFELNGNNEPFDLFYTGSYGDTNKEFLKRFMDEVCVHLDDRKGDTHVYHPIQMKVYREEN